jgi:hypothetical protein
MAYGLGGVAAVLAFGIGVSTMRPAMLRAAKLSQQATEVSGAEKEAQLATANALRSKAAKAGRAVAGLLTLAAVTMALGRYL